MARKTPWFQTLSHLVSEHRAPPGGRSSLSPKPRTLAKAGLSLLAIAMVAALSAGILFFWQGQSAEAQDNPPKAGNVKTQFDYRENGTVPVATYTARDPDKGNLKIFWTLGGDDAGDFTIDGGVLRFKSTPDYEVPKDMDKDNVYRVTVRYGAGGQDGTPADDDYDGDDLDELDLTVTVINVEEGGMVVISPMRPQVGTELTAILTDEDVHTGEGEWQWASSDSKNGPWTDIPKLSNRKTYEPTIDDLGKYLRVTVLYVDGSAVEPTDTVEQVSTFPVRKDIVTSNRPSKFPDQSTLTGHTGIFRDATDRFIPETAAAGTKVGAPVTAFDDDTALEEITYSLRDGPTQVTADNDNDQDTPRHNDGQAMEFNIDVVTGQITVSAMAALDADGEGTNPYTVVVRAVDPDGDIEDIAVTIHVLTRAEAPRIDGGPREMSHYEHDRTARSSTDIDADLDTSVLDPGTPDLKTDQDTGCDSGPCLQPALYMAIDEDDGDVAGLKWAAKGDDGWLFNISKGTDIVASNGEPAKSQATLSFKTKPQLKNTHPDSPVLDDYPNFPDFEKPRDKNRDNVYEVTIVVTDSSGNQDMWPVSVKVINSEEDNQPGKVTILNRQPEVATALVANFNDKDGGIKKLSWQWYRSTANLTGITNRTRCPIYNPHADGATDDFRYFIDTAPGLTGASVLWEKIPGATSSSHKPHYNATVGGAIDTEDPRNAEGSDTADKVEVWKGGDIDVVITTDADTGVITYAWESPRCLRAVVTYEDAVDRTHKEKDDPRTSVNETLEGTFMGSEYPVKGRDESNDTPEFRTHGDNGIKTSLYNAEEIEENTAHLDTDGTTLLRIIKDDPTATTLAAHDPMEGEDDDSSTVTANYGPDILTYALSGPDAKHFEIIGSVDMPSAETGAHDPTSADHIDGQLRFKSGVELDYEKQREYRVTISATDPSNEKATVNVVVPIGNENEGPDWVNPKDKAVHKVTYQENSTDAVYTYLAADEENPPSGVIYALVDAAITAPAADAAHEGNVERVAVTTAEIADNARFEISPVTRQLTFKSPPNYEDPKDSAVDATGTEDAALPGNNVYHVTVKATVTDKENPRHFIVQKIQVTVTNVNEAPVFSRSTDTLEISENPDDPEKEPPLAEGYLYLLNRGVGKPATNKPEAPDLDVGIPMVAVDDDNTWTAFNYTSYTRGTSYSDVSGSEARPVQLIDGLTYELSGDDKPFYIVPATGQILTREKLDYEIKNTYKVTVKATDPQGATDSIPLTINVTDVEEVPVAGVLAMSGDTSHSYDENGRDVLGDYIVTGNQGAVAWTLEGTDASHFMLDGSSIRSRMLKFKASPDYEMPRGMAKSATNTNTYMVTVKATSRGEMQMTEVTVTVENVEEAGSVTLSATGGKVGTPLTAMLSDDDGVVGTPDWQWYRVVNGTSYPITGARSASYTPVAADVGNLLKVTASYNDGYDEGNTASASITTLVADANAAPEFATATATRMVAENMASGALVGDPVTGTDPNGDVITYRVAGDDAANFSIDSATGQIMTSAMLDHEAKGSHMITVTATDPEGATGEIAVTVNVTNVDEAGMVSLSPAQPSLGTEITASVTDPDGGVSGETWQWSYSDTMNGLFTPYLAEKTASIIPALADVGRYLRITVTYNDVHGAKTIMQTTGMVVRNAAPMFASETTTRSVAENTASGMDIGDPVAATDADNDMLTYTLSGTDASHFDIGMSTGQLMTKSALDYETGKKQYMVTVMATDPYGAYDSIMVTIMVTDVDETPPGPIDPNAALIARYDTNGTPGIQKDEVITAINDYLFGTGAQAITKAQVIVLINLYLFG